MNNSTEQHDDIVLNEAGVSCDTDDTELIMDEHTRWRQALARRKPRNVSRQRYWKVQTSCASL